MATKQAKAQRRSAATKQIEHNIRQIGEALNVPPPPEPEPREYRGDRDMREIVEWERMATWLDRVLNALDGHVSIPAHYARAEALAREGANKADIVAALLNEDRDGNTDE